MERQTGSGEKNNGTFIAIKRRFIIKKCDLEKKFRSKRKRMEIKSASFTKFIRKSNRKGSRWWEKSADRLQRKIIIL